MSIATTLWLEHGDSTFSFLAGLSKSLVVLRRSRLRVYLSLVICRYTYNENVDYDGLKSK